MISSRMPHFPLPSSNIKPFETGKDPSKNINGLKGRTFPAPCDGQISLASIFSTSLFRRDFSTFSCAIIQNELMGLTFQQLDDMARRVARIIASKIALIVPGYKEAPVNLDGDSVVAVACEDTNIDERLIVFVLAILKLGATYLSFRPSQTDELELKRLVQQTQPLIIIVAEDKVPEIMSKTTVLSTVTRNGKVKVRLPHQVWTIHDLWDEAVKLTFEDSNDISVTPLWSKKSLGERTAGIFSCEDSIGKGSHWIRIGHRAILNRIHWEKTEFPIQENEKCYLTYPLADPRSIFQIFLPLCAGKTLTLLDPSMLSYPSYLLGQIVQDKLFRLNLSPRQLEKLLDVVESTDNQAYLATVRFWMVSGDIFPFHIGQKFFKVYPKDVKRLLIVFYGCPEVLWAATWCAFSSLKELKKHSAHGKMCVGVPLHNTFVHIIDDKNCVDCPIGDKGEICISGGSVAIGGYAGKGIKGKPGMVFQTGDLGRIIQDKGTSKLLIVEGRTSTRMKLDRRVIDFEELAELIMNTKIVTKCVIFSAPRTKDVQTIVAAYVPLPKSPEDSTEYLNSSDIYDKIKSFEPSIAASIPVNAIPTFADGQIDFRSLRKEYHKYLTSGSSTAWMSLKSFSKEKKRAAKVLFKSVASSLGLQVEFLCDHFMKSFWGLGGTATQSVRTMIAAEAQGYLLTPEDFVVSGRLDNLIERMVLSYKKDPIWTQSVAEVKSNFFYEDLAVKHRKGVMKLLKNDYAFKVPGQPIRLDRFWTQILDAIIHNNLSVVAVLNDQVIGVGLNCKMYPKVKAIPTEMTQVLNFFQNVTEACKSEVNANVVGKLAKSYYFAIDEANLSPAQKVLVIRDLLDHSFTNVRSQGCCSFLLCTTKPLIQEICTCLLNYKTLCELPINRYKTKDLQQPFWDKDDHHKIGVYLKIKNKIVENPEKKISKPAISQDSNSKFKN